MDLAAFKDWSIAEGSVAKYDDGQFKGECVSLVNQYCYRVLGIPAGAWGHAKDWATNLTALTYFDKVNSIQPGDVLVYGATPNNPYGHIEIALDGQALGQNRNLDGKVRVSYVLKGYSTILRSKHGETMLDENGIKNMYLGFLRRPASVDDIKYWNGKPYDRLQAELMNTSAYGEINDLIAIGRKPSSSAQALLDKIKDLIK